MVLRKGRKLEVLTGGGNVSLTFDVSVICLHGDFSTVAPADALFVVESCTDGSSRNHVGLTPCSSASAKGEPRI